MDLICFNVLNIIKDHLYLTLQGTANNSLSRTLDCRPKKEFAAWSQLRLLSSLSNLRARDG